MALFLKYSKFGELKNSSTFGWSIEASRSPICMANPVLKIDTSLAIIYPLLVRGIREDASCAYSKNTATKSSNEPIDGAKFLPDI